MAEKGRSGTGEKTCIKGNGFSGHSVGSHISAVDVKDGRITRIRPLHYDWKYKPEEFKPWKLEARNKVFDPGFKSMITPFSIGYKKRVYSPNRILYPLKRVDWDPNGERNPQNRGKSKYVRISWDEATTIVADEIKRIHKKYGPEAIFVQGEGHSESKVIHGPHGCSTLLLNHMGGYTQQIRNPDSWEGWYWEPNISGAASRRASIGIPDQPVSDIAKNTDMFYTRAATRDYSVGFWRRPDGEPVMLLVHRTGNQADLGLPGPELRRGSARGQMDTNPAQYRCRYAASHSLYMDYRRYL
jgi:trimethylamine-N-oxide reductase (cytochrome c)